jgi:hypothetical protein
MAQEFTKDFIQNSINELKDELPVVMTFKDLQKLLPFGKNSLYSLLNSNEIPNKKVKNKFMIPRDKFLAWLYDEDKREKEEINYGEILG